MTMAKKIRIVLMERQMKIKELAKLLGISESYMSNKLTKDDFSEQELRKIADLLNCDYDATFTMRDTGKVI